MLAWKARRALRRWWRAHGAPWPSSGPLPRSASPQDHQSRYCCRLHTVRVRVPDEFPQRHPATDGELKSSCVDAIDRMRPSSAATKSLHRAAGLHRVGGDCADGRERVLDAMVQLGQQSALLFLDPFALGYVNADADDSVRLSSVAKGNETARLDPSQLATRTNDTILDIVFAPALTKRLAAGLFYPSYVVGVHASQAFAACYLGSAFRKAVDGRIAVRNLHDLRVGVIRVTTNEASLCCQGKLYVALGQRLFRPFALSNVDLGSDASYWLPSFVV